MKNTVSFLSFYCWLAASSAQIGATLRKVESFIGKDQIITTRNEMGYIMQDIKIAKNEVVMIGYNSDSVAVLVAYGKHDSAYSTLDIQNFILNNIPKYKGQLKTSKDNDEIRDTMAGRIQKEITTYHLDTVQKILMLINYHDYGKGYVISGFGAITDYDIISSWVAGLTAWIKE